VTSIEKVLAEKTKHDYIIAGRGAWFCLLWRRLLWSLPGLLKVRDFSRDRAGMKCVLLPGTGSVAHLRYRGQYRACQWHPQGAVDFQQGVAVV
jgi:hypothetical protein